MNKIKKLVFATNNAHKLQEARQIISDGFEIVSLAEIGCHDDIPETADTLEGNALIKARWVKERYGYDCFADDTGLMVDALDGAPGVYSARYAGEHCSPADNVAKLLHELEGEENRRAHFATTVALICAGEEHCFEGRVEGRIATEPHGNGGFGYDPIFIADETGKCFAEMSADDKNAISHRGRAMRRLKDFLGVVVALLVTAVCSFAANASEWRLHPSYNGQMERVVETPNYTYFLGAAKSYTRGSAQTGTLDGMLFRYDKEGEEMMFLNKLNILSGGLVRSIEFNYDKNYLVVAYEDGDIDLLYENGDVVNIPGLKLADSSLDKTVNNINFDPASNRIYLATQFGYVVVNDALKEIETSRIFNVPLVSVVPFKGNLWFADDNAIYYGSEKEFDFSKLKKFQDVSVMIRMVPVGKDYLYLTHGPTNEVYCNRIFEKSSGVYSRESVSVRSEKCFETYRDGVFTVNQVEICVYTKDGKTYKYALTGDDKGAKAGSLNGTDFWFAYQSKGVARRRVPKDGSSSWTTLIDNFMLNAANPFTCRSMAYNPDYGMLVRNNSMDLIFNSAKKNYFNVADLISGYKDMTWTPLSATYRIPDMKGLAFQNPNGIAIDPNNRDHVYCGSPRTGLLRYDLANPEKSLHMSKATDVLGGNGNTGFVVVAPEVPSGVAWQEQCTFIAPEFDNQGNLWTAYINPSPDNDTQYVATYVELWVWPAADIAATTSPSNFREWKKIRFDGIKTGSAAMVLPLKVGSNKNIVLYHGNSNKSELIVLDNGGTPANTADDRSVHLASVSDQDGTAITFTSAYAWHEDPLTGLVWVSYGSGLFTFDPKEFLNGSTSVRRIKVPRNDGTNLADYLLDNVQVNRIISDGNGRKWFATNGAGLVCTSSDGREIIRTYTPENSDIPGSSVFDVCYNPAAGSIMVSTDKGLAELFLPGSSSESGGSGVRAYPNPVNPDYYGYVTIDGLPDDAMVKIVDTYGNVVKECGQADGGVVQWDVTNRSAKRVPGGVYFVIATNGPDSDSYSKMTKLLVIE